MQLEKRIVDNLDMIHKQLSLKRGRTDQYFQYFEFNNTKRLAAKASGNTREGDRRESSHGIASARNM